MQKIFTSYSKTKLISNGWVLKLFQGSAKMISRPDELKYFPNDVQDKIYQVDKNFDPQNYSFFGIEWLSKYNQFNRNPMSFQATQNLQNHYLPTHPLTESPSGQELSSGCAQNILSLFQTKSNFQLSNHNINMRSPSPSYSSDSQQNSPIVLPPPILNPSLNIQQSGAQLQPVQLVYPLQPPFGVIQQLFILPYKLFIMPILIQNEKTRVWTKGPGGLAEFLLKQVKKDLKESKDSKDHYKDNRDQKEYKDNKNYKDSRDKRDNRDREQRRKKSRDRKKRRDSRSSSRDMDIDQIINQSPVNDKKKKYKSRN